LYISRSLVEIKKSSLEYTFKKLKKFKKLETLLPAEVTEAKEIKKL